MTINQTLSSLHNMPMGFILVCTDKSEKYMFESLIFPQSKTYRHRVFAVKPEDYIFLYNLDADTLYGPFVAETEGQYDPNLELFEGKYPYYVKVKTKGEIKKLKNASTFLSMKEGAVLGWLIGDQWAKGVFVPVGLRIYERLTKHFEPIDIVCVVRRNQTSNTPFWQSKALQHNFYLRGFKYLFVVRKANGIKYGKIKVKWNFYER